MSDLLAATGEGAGGLRAGTVRARAHGASDVAAVQLGADADAAVAAAHRLRGAFGDDAMDPVLPFRGDVAELARSLLTDQIGKALHRRGVCSISGPSQPPSVVIEHAEPVALLRAVRDLHRCRDPLQDRQGHPCDVTGQPHPRVPASVGETRPVPRRLHCFNRHPSLDADHPGGLGLRVNPGRTHPRHRYLGRAVRLQLYRFDPQHRPPFPTNAHAVLRAVEPNLRQLGTTGRARRAP